MTPRRSEKRIPWGLLGRWMGVLLAGSGGGCRDKGDSTEPNPSTWPDADGDGFDTRSDCDDTNPAVSPEASEILFDGLDNDCDPDTLDDDGDGDGFGVEEDCDDSNPALSPAREEVPYDGLDNDCNPDTPDDDLDGDGFASAYDCVDTEAEINPLAEEIPYDGWDNDCNPKTEDDDFDGDGFGIDTDCNDTDPALHPYAEDLCDNGVDENCSGRDKPCALVGSIDGEDADTWIAGEACGLQAIEDTQGDGLPDLLYSELGATHSEGYEGVRLFSSPFPSGEVEKEDAEVVLLYDAFEGVDLVLCEAARSAGDLNGDGQNDIFAGWVKDGVYRDTYLLYGPLVTDWKQSVETYADVVISWGDYTAWAPGYIEDLNGSGESGIAMGLQNFVDSNAPGLIWIGQAASPGGLYRSDKTAEIFSSEDATLFQLPEQTGDVNGDGISDSVVVEATYQSDTGRVYLMSGPLLGEMSVEDSLDTLTGPYVGSSFGFYSGEVGDIDQDGYPEMAMGVQDTETEASKVYLFSASLQGHHGVESAVARFDTTLGENTIARNGMTGGDVNGDGSSDLLVEVIWEDKTDNVHTYLLPGPLSGTYDPYSSAIQADFSDLYLDYQVGLKDLDADGRMDIVLPSEGQISIFYGASF